MRVVFISNFFNHHQKPFSDKMFSMLGNDYNFIETEKIPEERKKMGYKMENIPPYVVSIKENEKNESVPKLIADADILLVGSAPEKYIKESIHNNKIVIRYSERPLKKGIEIWKYPVRLLKWHKYNPQKKNMFLLCASAYTIGDYQKFCLFKNKAFKWGYFTETKKYNLIEEKICTKSSNTILWAGRFLKWKHVDDVIAVSKKLKDNGYVFKVELIGTGEMLPELKKMVIDNQLEDTVHFLGTMKPEQVREYMEKAGIYLFTSDKQEGWGAVLNESMNSGCAVVVSHEIGAVPYLIKDSENGYIYESGNINMLYQKVKYLLDHPEEQKRIGKAAYETIIGEWNAEVAAERFVELGEKLLKNESVLQLFKSGPCSPAEVISDKWNKRK